MAGGNKLNGRPNTFGNPDAMAIINRAIGDAPPESNGEPVIIYEPDPNALIPQGEGVYVYKRFVMTPVGMQMPDDVTGDEWQEVGHIIKGLDSSISWVVGDWAAHANAVWGWAYAEIAEHFGYTEETLMAYASVCRSISTLIRNQGVPFGHHRLVTKLPEDQQRHWLDQAAKHKWRVADMKKAIAGKSPALSDGNPVYLIPPEAKKAWNYISTLEYRRRAGEEYQDAVKYLDYMQAVLDEARRKLRGE